MERTLPHPQLSMMQPDAIRRTQGAVTRAAQTFTVETFAMTRAIKHALDLDGILNPEGVATRMDPAAWQVLLVGAHIDPHRITSPWAHL
ncbi:hypothetical protein [Stenotrophomonas indicatrix]|uniref:hypothetical protein n=1 Tax=Stenotrophomonas indicatrix TaxID=2045451 RepID=UPI0013DCFC6F|nr:hypothetical protein [Stenotrophomonas indicatrix]